jgi:TPR repeat protein
MRTFRSTVASLTSLALALQAPLAVRAADTAASAVPPQLGAAAAIAGPLLAAQGDAVAQRCERYAAPRLDPQYGGPREPVTPANREEALQACGQAAAGRASRPRYAFLYGRVLWGAGRYDEAARQFEAARAGGNPWGSLGLGSACAAGRGVAQDGARALRLFREAEAGGVPAWSNIGWLHEFGVGVAADANEAATWYRRGADAGDLDAYDGLMRLALKANPPRVAEGLEWARKAAERGSVEGQYALGTLHLTGSGVPKDEAAAARWYEKAARAGLPDAMYQLGLLYWTGRGVDRYLPAAFQWIRAAAELGDPGAQYELARMFHGGVGTARDPKAAFDWAMQAANAGVVDAQSLVGAMYFDGDGTARDHAAAARWFRQAAGNGHLFSSWRLGWQLRTGDGLPRSEAEAVQWFGRGAQQGDARSEAALGQGYMSGAGGRTDYRAAAYWYERAARKGEPSALINLGTLYANGWGVPRDPQRARALYVQASHDPDPYYARAARERLGQSSGAGGSGSNVDGGAVLGAALVGLLLYSAFSGGGSGGGGGGGSVSMDAGGSPGPWSGGSSTAMAPMQSPMRMSTPMSGNTTTIIHGMGAYGSSVNRR